ncbi:hypothetical protein [Rufibacter tibetensis]|uniref:Uncharacterized protein n=1 Tax=Rufibacter tibetensis TaxID=512763 RepID=A0A0P0CT51_9BACT|nr:hypothetical protein [Rufibacter tibetensis]ALJ00691.1 hypothetical protein DC20_19050 [Rufibacter tibetensis]
MRELVKSEIDKLQMSIIRSATNVEEVQAVLGIFAQMRELTNQLPEGTTKAKGAKRGRKAGFKNKEQQEG